MIHCSVITQVNMRGIYAPYGLHHMSVLADAFIFCYLHRYVFKHICLNSHCEEPADGYR